MADNNIPGLGRFSSQMLSYLGTQRTVSATPNGTYNTFKYNTGYTTFPSPGAIKMAYLGRGVVGSISGSMYDTIRCYYMSRGASTVYADTMTMLTKDIAASLGLSPLSLIEKAEREGKVLFTDDIMTAFNSLRDPSHQVSQCSNVNNRASFKSNEIRG